MINLRFHIVSIVAVFLALAIGILTGSTLLDRATVEVLQSRQKSLDSRNDELKDENDSLRSVIEVRDDGQQRFGTQALPAVIPGLLDEDPVLILAVRGIDEDVVNALNTTILLAGGDALGVVWFDGTFDLTSEESVDRIAGVLNVDASQRELPSTIVDAMAAQLIQAGEPVSDTPTETTTTIASEETSPEPLDAPQDVLGALVSGGLIEWSDAGSNLDTSRELPVGGLRVVLMSGEGADLTGEQFMYPLLRRLAAAQPGTIVAELQNPREDLEGIDAEVAGRGEFVNPVRLDEDFTDRVITIDNLDEPFGRLATVLAISGYPSLVSGAFGTAPSAQQLFPTAVR